MAFRVTGDNVRRAVKHAHGLHSKADIARVTGRTQARVSQWAESGDWPNPIDLINGKPIYAGVDIHDWLIRRGIEDAAKLVVDSRNGRGR